MPEFPDIVVYVEALQHRIEGLALENFRLKSMFLVRSVEPPVSALIGRRVTEIRRMGKQIVIGFENDLFAVIHLMIAGRLQWKHRGAALSGKNELAAFDFSSGSLVMTEAGTKKRASIHIVRGAEGLKAFNRNALEVFNAGLADFANMLRRENHTLKRSLTDPRLFSGIGNAYSDEILHRARLSPMKLTASLSDNEIQTLFEACRTVLSEWADRLRRQTGDSFPSKVTAFHPEMAVHGRYGKPCPVCESPVQRIVYAENECNYCARCQTAGKLLADRALSRLLHGDWPKSIDEL